VEAENKLYAIDDSNSNSKPKSNIKSKPESKFKDCIVRSIDQAASGGPSSGRGCIWGPGIRTGCLWGPGIRTGCIWGPVIRTGCLWGPGIRTGCIWGPVIRTSGIFPPPSLAIPSLTLTEIAHACSIHHACTHTELSLYLSVSIFFTHAHVAVACGDDTLNACMNGGIRSLSLSLSLSNTYICRERPLQGTPIPSSSS
jgi:hypothetical protein